MCYKMIHLNANFSKIIIRVPFLIPFAFIDNISTMHTGCSCLGLTCLDRGLIQVHDKGATLKQVDCSWFVRGFLVWVTHDVASVYSKLEVAGRNLCSIWSKSVGCSCHCRWYINNWFSLISMMLQSDKTVPWVQWVLPRKYAGGRGSKLLESP